MIKLINSFATNLHGSSLWSLLSSDCEKLYRAWNVMVRMVFRLDRTTHRRLIEPLSRSLHLKPALLSRYLKFCSTLANSRKFCIRYLMRVTAGNNNTVMGRTLNYIAEECNTERASVLQITPREVKSYIKYCRLGEHEEWKAEMGCELLESKERHSFIEIPSFTYDEIQEMLNYICTV